MIADKPSSGLKSVKESQRNVNSFRMRENCKREKSVENYGGGQVRDSLPKGKKEIGRSSLGYRLKT